MANIHEDNESCKERMKELIRKGKDRTEIIKVCKNEFENVNIDTFYRWYDSVVLDQDIKQWEMDNKIEIEDKFNDRRDLKEAIYQRNKRVYIDNKDPEESVKAEKILLTHFLDKIQ